MLSDLALDPLPRHHPRCAGDHRPAVVQGAVRATDARGFRVPNTNFYRAPEPFANDANGFGRWAADRIAEAIGLEGPDTVAAVFLEPVQNTGGTIPPPPGYIERVRQICDDHDVLLESDEVISRSAGPGRRSPVTTSATCPT